MAADEEKGMTQEEYKKIKSKGEKFRRRQLYYLDRCQNAPRDERLLDYQEGLLKEISLDKILPREVKTKLKQRVLAIKMERRNVGASFDYNKIPRIHSENTRVINAYERNRKRAKSRSISRIKLI